MDGATIKLRRALAEDDAHESADLEQLEPDGPRRSPEPTQCRGGRCGAGAHQDAGICLLPSGVYCVAIEAFTHSEFAC